MSSSLDSYIPHLIELRMRVIRCGLVILSLFICLFIIDEYLYSWIAKPLLKQLPSGSSMIATEVTAPFMAPMKLALISALFFGAPYILFELWSFIAPGLYINEKHKLRSFVMMSTLLFYFGIAFSYFVICPTALSFFTKCAPPDVKIMTDIKAYLDFVLSVLLAGGIAFQVPIITLTLLKAKLVSIEQFIYLRPYVIVGAFVLGMLLTPPDVISQILLALPMWGLFEIGLLLAKYLK